MITIRSHDAAINYDGNKRRDRRRTFLYRIPAVGAVIGVLLICVPWMPGAAVRWNDVFPARLSFSLFFLPQTAFPYDAVVWRDEWGGHLLFGDAAASLLNVLQWVVLSIALAGLTTRLKLRYALLIAAAAMAAFAVAGPSLFWLIGAELELDGP